MTVTIPATVTDLELAFSRCTTLTEVTLEHSYSDLTDGTVTMTNAFYGCTSLTKVICHNTPAINKDVYHAWRITPDITNNLASVQCFDRNGNALFLDSNDNPQDIEVDLGSSTNLTLEQTTNELSFGDISDTIVSKVMQTARAITNKNSVLDPLDRNFVLWANNTTNFKTNLNLSSAVQYPLGYVYMQLYNPTNAQWEENPIDLQMTPVTGCKWEEITSDFASYPYLKIGSGTTQTGHNAYHSHSGGNLKIGGEFGVISNGANGHWLSMAAVYGWSTNHLSGYDGYTTSVNMNGHNAVYHNGTNWSGTTSYNGSSAEQTNEVNASNIKIWKVVADV